MSIDFSKPAGTSLTINPEPDAAFGLRKPTQKATLGDNNSNFWGEGGFQFDDLLDLVNPLQHIPGVSTLYRAITGDTISPGAQLIGGGLLGGVTGFLASAADALFTQAAGGESMGSQLADLFAAGEATPLRNASAPPLPETTTLLSSQPEALLDALPALVAAPMAEPSETVKPDRHAMVLDLFDAKERALSSQMTPANSLIAAQEMAQKL